MRLTDSQRYFIGSALRIAAGVYEKDANEFRTESAKATMAESARLELIRSFEDQHKQAIALADAIEESDNARID